MKLTKPDMNFPMMAEMMQVGMPIQLPEMSFDADPISKFFYNLSLRQLAKSEELKGNISISRNTQTTNYIQTMERIVLSGERVFEERQKMKDDQATRKAELQKLQAEASAAYYEAKISEMEFKKREKEFQEEYGIKPA